MAQPNLSSDVLRTFVTVIEEGGFIKAADQLHKTQSTISQQIKKLESEVGVSLFRTEGRKRLLTVEGEMMLSYAHRMLALQEDAVAALSASDTKGELRLGVSPGVVDGVLPVLLSEFAKANPGIRLHVETHYSDQLLQGWDRDEYDLILTLSLNEKEARGEILGSEPLVWIGPEGYHYLPGQEIPLATLTAPCQFRNACINALNDAGIPWRPVYTTSSNSSLMAAVKGGLAITVRTESAAKDGTEILQSDQLPELPNVYVVLRHNKASKVADLLANQLKKTRFEIY